MSYTEWISRMAEALSRSADHLVMAELYCISKELHQQDAKEKQHWSK